MRYTLIKAFLESIQNADVKISDVSIDDSKECQCEICIYDSKVKGIVAEVKHISPYIVYYRGYSISMSMEHDKLPKFPNDGTIIDIRIIDERNPYDHQDQHYQYKNIDKSLWFEQGLRMVDTIIINESSRYNSGKSPDTENKASADNNKQQDHTVETITKYLNKELSAEDAASLLGVSRTKFYNMVKPYR